MKKIVYYSIYLKIYIQKYPRLFLFFSFFIFAIMGFEEIVDDVFLDPKEGDYESDEFDKSIFSFLADYKTTQLTTIMRDLTSLGSISIISILTLISSTFLYISRRYKDLSYFLITILGSGFIAGILKVYFARNRPPSENWLMENVVSMSFPSGHSLLSTTTYFAIAYILSKKLKSWKQEILTYIVAFTIIMLVGLSRMYLGVHYPTDVLGGISIGAAWVLLTSFIHEAFVFLNKYFPKEFITAA